MNLITKNYKPVVFFFMLFAFLIQHAVAANDKQKASEIYEIHKINNTPIIKCLELIEYLPDYSGLHLDYFADECKQIIITKSPLFLTLIVNCMVASYFGIEDANSMFYLSCRLLLLNFFVSAFNTLLHPDHYIQVIFSLIFYGFDQYVFPLYSVYSVYSVSNSYIDKLGNNGVIPAFLYGITTLKSLLMVNNYEHANIRNINTIATNTDLPIQPKMYLLKKLLKYKDYRFLYSNSVKLNNNDNLMSKFYKWIAFHADDISLGNISDLALQKNSIESSESERLQEISNARQITFSDLLDIEFYKNPLFSENYKLKEKIFIKSKNYICDRADGKLNFIINVNQKLAFMPIDNSQINDSSYLVNLLNKFKSIVVETTRQKFAPQENILNDEHKYFGVINNKGTYYLFLGLNLADRSSTIFTRMLYTLPKALFWFLALGNLSFSYQPCLIIKFSEVDKLTDVIKTLMDYLKYDSFKTNVYAVSAIKKK